MSASCRLSARRSTKSSITDSFDNLSLHEAAWYGDGNVKQVLRNSDSKFRINDPDTEWGYRTALHIAAYRGNLLFGNVACCRTLLDNGASPQCRMNDGWTPAHCAAESGHLKVLKILAEYSADLSACDDYGDSPKKIAQIYGHNECVEYLSTSQACGFTDNNQHIPKNTLVLKEDSHSYGHIGKCLIQHLNTTQKSRTDVV